VLCVLKRDYVEHVNNKKNSINALPMSARTLPFIQLHKKPNDLKTGALNTDHVHVFSSNFVWNLMFIGPCITVITEE